MTAREVAGLPAREGAELTAREVPELTAGSTGATPATARGWGTYPQAELQAGAMRDGPAVRLPAGIGVSRALARLQRCPARAGTARRGRWVVAEDLARAEALGLGRSRADGVSRRLPLIAASQSEVAVRRACAAGVPLVIVRGPAVPLGTIACGAGPAGEPLERLARRRFSAPTLAVLDGVARLAARRGERAYLVGGAVRDLLLDRAGAALDLDLVVEGDGLAFARALGRDLERSVRIHARFLTASLSGRAREVAEVTAEGAVDVATARTERYPARGALPVVRPSAIGPDLARRDFSVNALALDLGTPGWPLLDGGGGLADLRARRLRVLHPLAFVEDPTRAFRAARYAARLGFALAPETRRALALALAAGGYTALSGARLLAELERAAREVAELAAAGPTPGGAGAWRRVTTWRLWRFLETGLAAGAAASRYAARLPQTLAWLESARLDVAPLELALVTILAGAPPRVRCLSLDRLGVTGRRRERLLRVSARPLARGSRPRGLDGGSDLELAWEWLRGGARRRAVVALCVVRRGDALRGEDLLRLGMAPGPGLGRLLAELRQARLDGRLGGREEALAEARARLAMLGRTGEG